MVATAVRLTIPNALHPLLQSSPPVTVLPTEGNNLVNKFFMIKLWQKSINKFLKGKTILWATPLVETLGAGRGAGVAHA